MAKRSRPAKPRSPLSKDRVLHAALGIADREGLEAVSMRRLGQELGVEAMSVYGHVASKDEILDGLADLVVGEIELPSSAANWKKALRQKAISAHEVLLRHPWASVLIESRMAPTPARLRHHNALVGILRKGGFSIELAYHANLALDSYIYGFTLQEVSWPFEPEDLPAAVEEVSPQIPEGEYPYLAEIMAYVMGPGRVRATTGKRASAYTAEFEFGLSLILDGLERAARR